jgi:methylmalonyl-CoA mutase
MTNLHHPVHPVRFVTATSLFDGHDAAINIMRRLLQAQGAEVIHLGHDRSVDEVVQAALQEDVQGIAVSSYQGGHLEYFGYLRERLDAAGAGHIRIYGGGGGVIVDEEIAELAGIGVRIFSPQDGQRLGLPLMINELIAACDTDLADPRMGIEEVASGSPRALARAITTLQAEPHGALATSVVDRAASTRIPVLGITGTGGSGKSSLTDELVRRFRMDSDDKVRIAVLAIDPTRTRGGGALLGDRIRMNAIDPEVVFFRSLATRGSGQVLPEGLRAIIGACKVSGFDLVIVETPGIGQGDAAIVDVVDLPLYVMTPEFGAASQLEKIDMLDFAHTVAINKFERRGADDARRSVARQLLRNRGIRSTDWESMPVFGTSAARFNDDGVLALYQHLKSALREHGLRDFGARLPHTDTKVSTELLPVLPKGRDRYLAEIAQTVRHYHRETDRWSDLARRQASLVRAAADLQAHGDIEAADAARRRADALWVELPGDLRDALEGWNQTRARYAGDSYTYHVRGRVIEAPAARQTLSGTRVPRVALPHDPDAGTLTRFIGSENLPGPFPITGGVFPLKRSEEAPTRMFAGEGDAARTNRRFHLLSKGQPATRLSTAFDSVTLYGRNPDQRPDIYGKVGTSGVSIATIEDMRTLYAGFDLCAPNTSVSMTINGPAPTILAMYLNTAIDQQVDRFRDQNGREPNGAELEEIRSGTLATVRGTVQADILKEDQGQNTCIFSTEFSLRCMSDVQEWFIANHVRNFYSVSISGYHIAEAGANPISQLAFTLANGFTYVESFLARGMDIDEFAPNLSFFFSNGMDAEYTVIGRVARRIWAIAMRDRYGADERAQKLKYHIQTSGRSLHAQEVDFNDIRTTLQALCALYDNANSLHTNAYDEAITTPSAHSVRRALAIQMIINQEWGLSGNENPLQGSYIVEELTALVEEAVLAEFDQLADRGGVLGAMESGYQRGKIQDESMRYEEGKHDGSIPIIGVNTFIDPEAGPGASPLELARGTTTEREQALQRLAAFHAAHAADAETALQRLRRAAINGENLFAELMEAVRVCSLEQITRAFFDVGGQYRRNV